MSERCLRRTVIFMFFIAMLWLPNVLAAEEVKTDRSDKWQFSIKPYAWFPTIEADLKFIAPNGNSGSPTISVDPDDYFENLDLAAIMTIDVRKEKWSFTADFVYMDLKTSGGKVKSIDFLGSHVSTELDIGSDIELQSFISTFGAGYQIIDNHWLKMDMIAGVRYMWMESQVDWRLSGTVSGPGPGQSFASSGNLTEDVEIWNGIGGIRGTILLGESNWFIPFYADVGTGDTDLTWQVFTALGYSLSNRIDAMLGFRHLVFEEDGNQVMQELRLSGPLIGAIFRF